MRLRVKLSPRDLPGVDPEAQESGREAARGAPSLLLLLLLALAAAPLDEGAAGPHTANQLEAGGGRAVPGEEASQPPAEVLEFLL